MLNAVMLSVVMLNVVMLSVVRLNVLAPFYHDGLPFTIILSFSVLYRDHS
jgi:hypothetical protein